jgi:phage terminase large subunit-like protein
MADLFEPSGRPFTLAHFCSYAGAMIFDDGKKRKPEPWQRRVVGDLFRGVTETWLIVPEGNGKTTFMSQLVLYGADYSRSPWIPLGAASREQAEIIYTQAQGFVERNEWLAPRFRCYDGYRKITSTRNGGKGIQVYAADVKTGDGVIPYPYAVVDELHRHDDLRLYSLWKGKLRKRGAQILTISTAGEPETEFELMRDKIRDKAKIRKRRGAYLRAEGPGLVLHEYMVRAEADCDDMKKVKQANPLAALTVAELRREYESPTFNAGDWKRLKCNRPTRASITAITEAEWDQAEDRRDALPAGKPVIVGVDVGWKWDTTAITPLWKGPSYRLLGPATILEPPRDGSTLHPDEIKLGFEELQARNPIEVVVMDTSKAEDIAAWLEDDLGVTVIDREQSNTRHVADYEAFTDGLRNGTLKHTGDYGLRSHVLNAIARRLPGGDYRFDRPIASRRAAREQDRRVIDALTAAGMAVEESRVEAEPVRSVYEDRGIAS